MEESEIKRWHQMVNAVEKPVNLSTLARHLRFSPPTVGRALDVLEARGLIKTHKIGNARVLLQ